MGKSFWKKLNIIGLIYFPNTHVPSHLKGRRCLSGSVLVSQNRVRYIIEIRIIKWSMLKFCWVVGFCEGKFCKVFGWAKGRGEAVIRQSSHREGWELIGPYNKVRYTHSILYLITLPHKHITYKSFLTLIFILFPFLPYSLILQNMFFFLFFFF